MPLNFIDGGQIPNGVAGFVDWVSSVAPAGFNGNVTIVSESFVLDGRTKFPDLTPVRIEGALTALLGDGVVHYQRNTYKGRVGDDKLKELGFWIPGQRHQMDARLHALAYLKTQGHLPTVSTYWPELLED